MLDSIADEVEQIAVATRFSGAVQFADEGRRIERAYGLADRAHDVSTSTGMRFAIASGSKVLTALTVMRLVETGSLSLTTAARTLLGTDLPLIADEVTVEHLLAHRSGIGDYLDESVVTDVNDYVLGVGPQSLATTDGFLPLLDGHPTAFPAGERFAYCNGGYLVLALLVERATGQAFHDVVRELVTGPTGMDATEYLRLDALAGDAAIGYLHGDDHPDRLRTNVLHLPVRGNGDGGAFTTLADVSALWTAFLTGRIVGAESVRRMIRPSGAFPPGEMRYGLGMWLARRGPALVLEGSDAGVSFFSRHDPRRVLTVTVVSNTSAGAWPIVRRIEEMVGDAD
jgi:CubicO group peptidase (beta-lactamase class C family)